jgi:hypothetical protein
LRNDKKHHATVTGTDLISMLSSAMTTVDPTSQIIATVMEQCHQMLQLAEQCQHDAEEPVTFHLRVPIAATFQQIQLRHMFSNNFYVFALAPCGSKVMIHGGLPP